VYQDCCVQRTTGSGWSAGAQYIKSDIGIASIACGA